MTPSMSSGGGKIYRGARLPKSKTKSPHCKKSWIPNPAESIQLPTNLILSLPAIN